MFKKKEWFYVDSEITVNSFAKYRLETAKELIDLVEKYLNEKSN